MSNVNNPIEYLGCMLDQSLMVDFPGRKVVSLLWEAAQVDQGQSRTLSAARCLDQQLSSVENPYVVLITGTLVRSGRPVGQTETDGPMGAAILCRALFHTYKTSPVIVTVEPSVAVVQAAMQAVGFATIATDGEGLRHVLADPTFAGSKTAVVCSLSPGLAVAQAMGQWMFDGTCGVGAVISVEMVGRNEHGVAHGANGAAKSNEILPWFDELVRAANAAGTPTIGIGDGGNELGMGNIKELLEKSLPGAKCKCPCNGSIVPAQTVEVFVPASISNWGAYAIAANVAAMNGDIGLIHDEELEEHLLSAVVLAGAVDGTTGVVERRVDGLTASENASFVKLIGALARTSLADWALR